MSTIHSFVTYPSDIATRDTLAKAVLGVFPATSPADDVSQLCFGASNSGVVEIRPCLSSVDAVRSSVRDKNLHGPILDMYLGQKLRQCGFGMTRGLTDPSLDATLGEQWRQQAAAPFAMFGFTQPLNVVAQNTKVQLIEFGLVFSAAFINFGPCGAPPAKIVEALPRISSFMANQVALLQDARERFVDVMRSRVINSTNTGSGVSKERVTAVQTLTMDARVLALIRVPPRSQQQQQEEGDNQLGQQSRVFPTDFSACIAMVNAFELLFTSFCRQSTGNSATTAYGDEDLSRGRVLTSTAPHSSDVRCFSLPYSIFPTTASSQSRVQIGFISVVVADTPRDLLAFPHIFTDGGFTVVILRQRITDRDQELASLCREVTSDTRYTFDPKDPLSCLERPLVFWLRSRQLNGKKPPPVHDLLLISSAKPKRLDEQLRSIGIDHDILLPAERWQREVRHGTRELNALVRNLLLAPTVACPSHTIYWEWEKQRFVDLAHFRPLQWAPCVDFEEKRASCTGGLSRWRQWIVRPSNQQIVCVDRTSILLDIHAVTCNFRRLSVIRVPSASTEDYYRTRPEATASAQEVIHLDLALALSSTARVTAAAGTTSSSPLKAAATSTATTTKPRLFCSGTHYTTIQAVLSFLTVFDAMKSLARVNRATWHEFEELRYIDTHCSFALAPSVAVVVNPLYIRDDGLFRFGHAVPFCHVSNFFDENAARRAGYAPLSGMQLHHALTKVMPSARVRDQYLCTSMLRKFFNPAGGSSVVPTNVTCFEMDINKADLSICVIRFFRNGVLGFQYRNDGKPLLKSAVGMAPHK